MLDTDSIHGYELRTRRDVNNVVVAEGQQFAATATSKEGAQLWIWKRTRLRFEQACEILIAIRNSGETDADYVSRHKMPGLISNSETLFLLRILLAAGLIMEKEEDRRSIYRITNTGIAFLEKLEFVQDQILSSVIDEILGKQIGRSLK
jgi:hypothetical protein